MKGEAPIYVVGFPKSGNTWLLRMLCDLCQANIDQRDPINRADYHPDRDRVIHKVHFAKISDLGAGARIVYIVRDVRDVLVSGFFHNHPFIAEESVSLGQDKNWKKAGLRRYFRYHLRLLNRGWRGNELAQTLHALSRWKPRQGHIGLNWSEHVSYWTGLAAVKVVRYEDLLQDAVSVLEGVLSHLGLATDSGQLRQVVRNQSFQVKKAQFRGIGDLANDRFLRSGRAGDWDRFLDVDLLQEITQTHLEGLRRMNYLEAR